MANCTSWRVILVPFISFCVVRHPEQDPSLHPERSGSAPARKFLHRRAPFVAGLAPSQLQPVPVSYSIFLSSAQLWGN